MDLKCFVGTIISVLKKEGVIEGGTGKSVCEEATFNNGSP
jgi:O-antigen biosynthesis protein WbqP